MVTPITQGQNPASSTVDLFDTETFPLDRPDSAGYAKMLETATKDLQSVNCAQLVDFIRPKVLVAMQAEAESLAGEAVFHEVELNPYFCETPEGTPADHPLNRFSPRRHGMVRADRFARDGVIWSVFQNPDLCRFVADVMGYETLHTNNDPYGSANVNVQPEGCAFA